MLRVFLCGAHSTGKTTLLNRFLEEPDHNFQAVHELARRIITENGWSPKDFDPNINPGIFYELQVKILQEQSRKDKELMNQNKSYISDRGLDPIIYCKMYLDENWFRQMMDTKAVEECIKRHKASNTLTVIIKPHQECLEEDGTRMTPKMDELIKFTELVEEFLKEHNIKFEAIADLALDDRISFLKSLVMEKKEFLILDSQI